MSEPETITASNGQTVPLKMSVDYISFSAHSDFLQTSEYIDSLLPPYVVRNVDLHTFTHILGTGSRRR
jgi:cleavage and polyadenylation specificity factor subunit 3